ncbi:MAG TPA: hypothetical protein VKX28_27355 [Xanthobacteraceae bacterium]|jgi:uncharacterized phage infection (PIP) family protein YhgE|nr:hypothetical protein [Xanthobacteraceae bacterium]
MTIATDAHQRDEQTRGVESTTLLKSAAEAASDAAARLGDAAQAAGRQAKEAASELSAEANLNIKGLLNNQLASGADLAGHVAGAVRAAADHLGANAPQLAGIVRTGADTIEDFSGTMRASSVEDVFQTASDFTRRQPAAVFGAAALAGFFLFRVLKVDGSSNSNIGAADRGQPRGSSHGA